MNWDQIEKNWAAMARRVRPDLPATGSYNVTRKPVGTVARSVPDDTAQNVAKTAPMTRHTS